MKLPKIAAALFCLLAVADPTRAEDAESFKMPCAQVVKLGFDKFMTEYTRRTQDESTAGQRHGYGIYAHCKGADNDRRMKVFSTARANRLKSIRTQLSTLEDSCWGLQTLAAGGGTMWGLFASAATATREDDIGELIRTLAQTKPQRPTRNSAARRQANALFLSTRKRLDTLKKPSTIGASPLGTVVEQKKLHADGWIRASAALTQLQRLSLPLPDKAALQLATRVDGSTRTAIDEA